MSGPSNVGLHVDHLGGERGEDEAEEQGDDGEDDGRRTTPPPERTAQALT